MKVALLDVGAGTLDFLLYESGKTLENCVKMVLPSPEKIHVLEVEGITGQNKDLYIDGYTVGGDGLGKAVKKHIEKGLQVHMTPIAAYSIRNNLSEVEEIGVSIVDEKPRGFEQISLDDLRLESIELVLNGFSETLMDVDVCAVSVKDHGAPPSGISNRVFRLENYRRLLEDDNRFSSFLYEDSGVPEYYLRMNSAVDAVRDTLGDVRVYLMDTSISALAGCLQDSRMVDRDPSLVVNVGNGHTVAAVVSGDRILSFFEHHTGRLNRQKLEYYLESLCEGEIENEEVYNDGGHGAAVIENPPGIHGIEIISVTGPRRKLLEGSKLEYIQASPGGDVMMTGTLGLLKAIQEK